MSSGGILLLKPKPPGLLPSCECSLGGRLSSIYRARWGDRDNYDICRIDIYDSCRRIPCMPAPGRKPTHAEVGILRVLWSRGPSTVRDVARAMGREAAYTTILKLMQNMTVGRT